MLNLLTGRWRLSCWWLLLVSLLLAGPVAAQASDDDAFADHAVESGSPQEPGYPEAHNPDPWESFNRPIHNFNDFFDRWLLRPVAKGYRNVTPDPVERSISNFFNNLGEPLNLVNNLLQGKWRDGASDGGRLLINTTIGVAGLFDVARHWGFERSNEDFGQTLGHWGVGSGPYLVLPFLGPRTLRDAGTGFVDGYVDPLTAVDHVRTRNQLYGARIIDLRAGLLAADELVTGDRYIFLRDAYLQRRQFLVNDGVVEDSFGDDDFEAWEE